MSVNDGDLPALTIVGLGPAGRDLLTYEAAAALRCGRLLVRTARHPAVQELPRSRRYRSFDRLYESLPDFEAVYAAIVREVLASAQRQPTVYAVPGHPLVGEATVPALLDQAATAGLTTKLVPGLSFLEVVFSALRLDPLASGLDILDALRPPRQIDRATLFCQVYDQIVASHLKLALLESLNEEFQVALVRAAGGPAQSVEWMPLYAIDRRAVALDHLTCLYVPPPPLDANIGSFHNFRQIVARLRGPDGCPWDRAQTHQSITQYLIEEAYEAVEALDTGDTDKLVEELGDVLLQVLLHAQIAEDAGEFAIEDVLRAIAAKMLRRHPHVFGDASAHTPEDVIRRWEVIKQRERAAGQSVLEGVPHHLPALAYAEAIQRKAASLGFEWPDAGAALAKLEEEAAELRAVADPEARRDEFGDLLFALANYGRMLGIDPEEALRRANFRFRQRFQRMEKLVARAGADLHTLPLPILLQLWERAKETPAEA